MNNLFCACVYLIVKRDWSNKFKFIHEQTTLGYGLMVSVSASHVVGSEFAPQPGHTKEHHKNGTDCLPAWHTCIKVGI